MLIVIESCEVSLWRRHVTHALGTTRRTSWVRICALGLVMWIAVSACALAQSSASAEARLKELSITLPPAPSPVANYVDAVRVGNLLFLAKGSYPAARSRAGRAALHPSFFR
jgi:hypothetical protein